MMESSSSLSALSCSSKSVERSAELRAEVLTFSIDRLALLFCRCLADAMILGKKPRGLRFGERLLGGERLLDFDLDLLGLCGLFFSLGVLKDPRLVKSSAKLFGLMKLDLFWIVFLT